MQVVLPGETLATEEQKEISIGPGLAQGNFDMVTAVKAGVVMEQNNVLFLDNTQKRYYPQLQEPVIGIVEGKMGDGYKVSIGASFLAFLESTAFEGATKRNKPNLVVGSIVYGRVVIANRDMDPEISCVGAGGKSEGFGELSSDGALINVGLSLARSLMNADHPILTAFAKLSAFELVVGLNGTIWIKGDTLKATFYLSDLLLSCNGVPAARQQALFQKCSKNFSKAS